MHIFIKPSADIRVHYNSISRLCKKTGRPVYLTKKGEGDLVVMDIDAYKWKERQLELRESLLESEERRRTGTSDLDAGDVIRKLREILETHRLVALTEENEYVTRAGEQ